MTRNVRGYDTQFVARIRAAPADLPGVALGLACVALNIPVFDVASELGVSRMTVYGWFTGTVAPRPERVRAIRALHVKLSEAAAKQVP